MTDRALTIRPTGPPYCDTCGRRVHRWQKYDGFGQVGFNRRTAAIVWHSKCPSKPKAAHAAAPPPDPANEPENR